MEIFYPLSFTMYLSTLLLLVSILCNTYQIQSFSAFLIFIVSSSKYMFFSIRNYGKCKAIKKGSHGHAANINNLPPGPTPWPVVGCLPTMLRNKPAHRWIHSIMKDFNTEIACIRLGNTHVISVSSPELAIEFLKTHDSDFASRPITMTTEMLTGGFRTIALTPFGDEWKKMRRIVVSEILSQSRLRWMHGKRIVEADNLLVYLLTASSNCSNNNLINLRSITQHYTANVMRRMIFNNRSSYYDYEEEDEYVEALFTLLLHVYAFCISDYMPCLKPFDLDGHKKIVKKALNVTKNYEHPIVDERVQQWREGKRKEAEDILDIFISLKDQNGNPLLSVDEIKVQITELMLAAVDNPSNAVEWGLAEMLNQPEILEKAVEELDKVVGKERLVQESDIPQLKYLTACAREALRIHPITPFNLSRSHIGKSDTDTVVGGYLIPKGSQVLLSRLGLGRNPRVWENPMRFDPNRHLNDGSVELGLAEPNLRFISFTRGRRGCMGGSLGTNITIMLFARLLQGFTWSLPFGMTRVDLSESDTLFLATPLHACAKPRLPKSMYPTHYR